MTNVEIIIKSPEAHQKGIDNCKSYYDMIRQHGKCEGENLPNMPYRFKSIEWQAYNIGWNNTVLREDL